MTTLRILRLKFEEFKFERRVNFDEVIKCLVFLN